MRCWILLLALVAYPAWAEDRLTLPGVDGGVVEIQPTEGQLLILHFWASWCSSCIDEIGYLERAAAGCPSERVRIVLVNVGEDVDVVRAFVKAHNVGLPVLRDPDGALWRRTDGRGLPVNLFWSSRGRRNELGSKTAEQWRRLLASSGCTETPSGVPRQSTHSVQPAFAHDIDRLNR